MDTKKDEEELVKGESSSALHSQDDSLSDVDDYMKRFSQQQIMITQLKEMVTAEEMARSKKNAENKLKLEKYTSQLARIRDRAKTSRSKPSSLNTSAQDSSDVDTSITSTKIETITSNVPLVDANVSSTSVSDISFSNSPDSKLNKPKLPNREVTKILHQQIKEHKAAIAERAKNEKELEKALIKIQKQLEENQNQSTEIAQLTQIKPKYNIQSVIPNEENPDSNKVVIELRNRIVQLESNILDLQETCKEKDSVIKSKTEAITLMSADFSKKGKDTVDLLDDTKIQMQQMQESFCSMEANMKSEKQSLINELEVYKNKIVYLEEANTILEGERFKLSVENNSLEERLSLKEIEINRLNAELLDNVNKIEELILKQKNMEDIIVQNEEKGMLEVKAMENLTKKIEDLERVNALLKETNEQLQSNNEKLDLSKIKERSSEVTELQSPNEIINALDVVANSLNLRILDLQTCILQKENELNSFKNKCDFENADKTSIVDENVDKIKALEVLNCELKKSNIDLQEKLNKMSKDKPQSPAKHSSPKMDVKSNKPGQRGKGSQKTKQNQQSKVELDKQNEQSELINSIRNITHILQTLNNEIVEKESILHEKQSQIRCLTEIEVENPVVNVENEIVQEIQEESVVDVPSIDSEIKTDTVHTDSELDIISLKVQLDDALKKIEELSKELSDSNKSMIKLKATHKSKIKQMQKSIDDYSKVSDSNSEVVRLQSEVNVLTQKITELEDDKGNLQLHLVDYDSDRVSDSQLNAKLLDMERIAEERLKAIADLEQQKFELVQELHLLRQQLLTLEDRVADLTTLENEHVSCEMKHVQLEEQLDIFKSEKRKLSENIEALLIEKQELGLSIEAINKEKLEINSKLESYINENMELIDRLEKLSAEKVSSAESIEMVESLTTQEKIEIEQYQKNYMSNMDDIKDDDNYAKMASEKSELERQEALEKIENLLLINNTLSVKLEELMHEKKVIEDQYTILNDEKDNISLQAKNNEERINSVNEKMEKLINENTLLIEKLEKINQNKSVTEIVVSETVEIEDSIEKEYITPQSAPVQMIESTPEVSEELKKSSKVDTKKFTKEILKLKNMLKHKDKEINDLNAKLLELTNNMQQMEQWVELNKIHDDQIENINMLQQTIAELNNDKKMLQDELITKNENIDKYDKMLKEINNEMKNNSENVVTSMKRHIITLNDAIKENDDEISELVLNINLYHTYSDKINYLIQELQEKIKITHLILINNKKEIRDILKERDNNYKKIAELEAQHLTKDDQINELDERLKNTLQNSQKTEITLKKLKELCKRQKANESKLEEQISQLGTDNKNYCDKIFELESKIKTENEALEIKLMSIVNEKEVEIEKYQNSHNCMESMREQFNNLQSSYDAVLSQLSDANLKITDLEPEISRLKDEISEMISERNSILSNLEIINQENSNLVIQNQTLQTKLTEYNTQLENLSQENISYLEKLEKKIEENDNMKMALSKTNILEEQLNHKEIEIKTLIEQLEKVQSNYKEFKSSQEAKSQEKDAFVESLETEMLKYKDKITRLEESVLKIEALERKVNNLKMKLNEKDVVHKQLLTNKEELELNYNQIESKMISHQEFLDTVTEENNKLIGLNNSLNETILILNNKLEASKAENDGLIATLSNMHVLENEKISMFEECNQAKTTLLELNEKNRYLLTEKERLEGVLQNQSENFDVQMKNLNSYNKKIQEELQLRNQQLNDAKEEIKTIKAENEMLISEKNALLENPVTSDPTNFFDYPDVSYSSKISVLNNEIETLNNVIKQKHEEIQMQNFTVEMQMSEFYNLKISDEEMAQFMSTESNKTTTILSDCFFESNHDLTSAVKAILFHKDQLLNKFFDRCQTLKKSIDQLNEEINQLRVQNLPLANESVSTVQSCAQYFTSPNIFNQQNREVDIRSIEDQIISSDTAESINFFDQDLSMIRAFQHDAPVPVPKVNEEVIALTSSSNIVEENITPKAAYVCYNEEVHKNNEINLQKIQELEEKVKILIEEKEKLSNDLQQSQLKTNKALIKLKEFKLRYDNLKKESSKETKSTASFDILDGAIQEELSSQVKTLEEKMKELKALLDKEKLEKDNLSKRVDILTSANDRLVNMKEKQDIELQMSMTKNQNLEKKLENMQWGSDFNMEGDVPEVKTNVDLTSAPTPSMDTNLKLIEELNTKLNNLQDENEELQSTVEKQTNEIKLMASNLSNLNENESCLNSALMLIKNENEGLKKLIEDNVKENSNLKSEFLKLQTIHSECQQYIAEVDKLKNDLHGKMNEIVTLEENLQESNNKLVKYENDILKRNNDISDLECNYSEKIRELERQMQEVRDSFDNKDRELQSHINNLRDDNDKLLEETKLKLDEANRDIANNKQLYESTLNEESKKYQTLLKECDNLKIINNQNAEYLNQMKNEAEHYQALFNENSDLKMIINQKDIEMSKLGESLERIKAEEMKLLAEAKKYEEILNESNNLKLILGQKEEIINRLNENYQSKVEESNSMVEIEKYQIALNENEDLKIVISQKQEMINRLNESCNQIRAEESNLMVEAEKYQILLNEHDNLRSVLNQKEAIICELNTNYNQIKAEESNLKDILSKKDLELQHYYSASYNDKLNEFNVMLANKDAEIQNKIDEVNYLNQKLASTSNELLEKIEEVQYLNKKIYDYDQLAQQLSEMEEKMSDLSHEKDAELANLRLRFNAERTALESTISESSSKITFLENQLETKIEDCRSINMKMEELQMLVDEEASQMGEMRSALEAQEIEIVTLKESLAEQTKAYEKIHKAYMRSERHVSFSEDTKPGDDSQPVGTVVEKTDMTDKNMPRADLDLALYMLHQRDVRCEELTVELMQLLEERDTLQLKLSNSLRMNEELRIKYSNMENVESMSIQNVPPSDVVQQQPSTSSTDQNVYKNVTNKDEELLENKISQLHNVNHLRDVRVKDERESRQKQMELLQRDIQHLPAEAVAQLREAHYTLSRDTQSASTVLLNWLWGKTTPKVVHM